MVGVLGLAQSVFLQGRALHRPEPRLIFPAKGITWPMWVMPMLSSIDPAMDFMGEGFRRAFDTDLVLPSSTPTAVSA